VTHLDDRDPALGRWWRWLAALAVFVPGGGLASHLLTHPEQPPDPSPAPADDDRPSRLAAIGAVAG
jgi:hypothetical protein